MSSITLGKRPEHYKPTPVKFPLPDGAEGVITATFRYRTRTEFGKLMAEHLAGLQQFNEAEPPTVQEVHEEGVQRDAALLLAVLHGWDLPDELTQENLLQLVDEVPACVKAFMDAYRAAVLEGRLGN